MLYELLIGKIFILSHSDFVLWKKLICSTFLLFSFENDICGTAGLSVEVFLHAAWDGICFINFDTRYEIRENIGKFEFNSFLVYVIIEKEIFFFFVPNFLLTYYSENHRTLTNLSQQFSGLFNLHKKKFLTNLWCFSSEAFMKYHDICHFLLDICSLFLPLPLL